MPRLGFRFAACSREYGWTSIRGDSSGRVIPGSNRTLIQPARTWHKADGVEKAPSSDLSAWRGIRCQLDLYLQPQAQPARPGFIQKTRSTSARPPSSDSVNSSCTENWHGAAELW